VWRCSNSTLMRCRNLQAMTTLAVRMIRRDIWVVKSHRHQPYCGKSAQSSASGTTPQYRAIPKPDMGLVCFRCGDAQRCVECQWTGWCSLCSQNHKDVVCRKNPNSKVHWELVSTPASGGAAHMLTASE
jgi:hypothetical protein